MRYFGFGLAAIGFSMALGACGDTSAALKPVKTTPAEVEKLVAELAGETFKGKATAAADVAAVRDALPQWMNLRWGGLAFDEASGATVLTAVRVTPADMPEVGLSVDEARLWDFDAELAAARLAGRRLGETAQLASRVDMKGIKVFGLETFFPPPDPASGTASPRVEALTTEEAFAAVDEIMSGLAPPALDSYEIGIGRLLFDDVVLRPFELKPVTLDPDSPFAKIMPLLQTSAAIARAFGANAYAAFDMKGAMSMTVDGETMSMAFATKAYGGRGSRGGDMDAAFLRDLTYDLDAPTAPGAGAPPMRMTGGVEAYTFEDMRLDKLYGYLARGEWPARSEADLLSLGLVTSRNERVSLNGVDLYSVAESRIDAREFHWFIPTKLSVSASDMAYNIEGVLALAAAQDPALAQDAGFQAMQPQILDMLRRYGLSRPKMDYALDWAWNAKSGDAQAGLAFGVDDYLRFDIDYEGGFPPFEAVSALIPGGFETAKGEEIARLFETASTFKGLEFTLSDEGGLEKIFAMVVEGGKMIPADQTGGVAVFQNQTPQSLRSMATAGAYMLAEQANAQLAGAKALIAPFAAFVEQGGTVKLTAAPQKPLPLAATARQLDSGALSPADVLMQLNARTVHTPPATRPN